MPPKTLQQTWRKTAALLGAARRGTGFGGGELGGGVLRDYLVFAERK